MSRLLRYNSPGSNRRNAPIMHIFSRLHEEMRCHNGWVWVQRPSGARRLFFPLTQIQDDKPRRRSDCRCAALSTQSPNSWKVKRKEKLAVRKISTLKWAELSNRRCRWTNNEALVYTTNTGNIELATVWLFTCTCRQWQTQCARHQDFNSSGHSIRRRQRVTSWISEIEPQSIIRPPKYKVYVHGWHHGFIAHMTKKNLKRAAKLSAQQLKYNFANNNKLLTLFAPGCIISNSGKQKICRWRSHLLSARATLRDFSPHQRRKRTE